MSETWATPLCSYCNGYHASKCPLVKAYEYHPDGTLKRVEFYEPQPIGNGGNLFFTGPGRQP